MSGDEVPPMPENVRKTLELVRIMTFAGENGLTDESAAQLQRAVESFTVEEIVRGSQHTFEEHNKALQMLAAFYHKRDGTEDPAED